MKKAVVIGSGFAGLSAAAFLAKGGWQVSVVEKHGTPGGRARRMRQEGFSFDMGPSWYWMPGIFDRFFQCFGKAVSDYYTLTRLDPSYAVYFPQSAVDIPADYEMLQRLFETMEPGSAKNLDKFLAEASYKYEIGMKKLAYKPGLSMTEFFDVDLAEGILRLDVFTDMKKHIGKFFRDPRIRRLLEFPVLFLGALPQQIPALYSLMNYADIKLGTWYPQGGIYAVVEAMHDLAENIGVKFFFGHDATAINITAGKASSVTAVSGGKTMVFECDAVISAADYHFTETRLLPEKFRSYSAGYWQKRKMAPSCLLYYIGINKKLHNVCHHSLFFDTDFDQHGREIYDTPEWPSKPLFYVSVTSTTDESTAPPGCENLFFLVPVASGLGHDTEELREIYFTQILARFEQRTQNKIRDSIIFKRSYSVSDFVSDYNAFKGNAYGLANTLMQTAILKPRIKSKKVKNLFFAGQLTAPGPGVPPALISGEIAAAQVIKEFG